MPVVNDAPSAPPDPKPSPIKVVAPTYVGVAVDTRYTPKNALLTHVEGSSWTVDYYSQVVARDSALSGQNLDRDAAYQQYKKIVSFELKVTSPLTQNQDTATKAITVNGQANVYPCGVIPNEGDMFEADIGDGRSGVFRITSCEQRSIYQGSGWIVDYVLIDYSTPERSADFKEKTVEELIYVKDFLTYGQNPLIASNEYYNLQRLNQLYDEGVQEYFRRFMSNEYRTLVLPGQRYAIYDPFITKALLSVFSGEASTHVKFVRELNVSDDDVLKEPTFWDTLLARKPSRLRETATQMGLVTTASFSRNPMMNSLRYSGMQYIVYPTNPDRSEDDIRAMRQKALSDWEINGTRPLSNALEDLIPITELDGLPQKDVVPINFISTSYVFSPAFYNRYSVGQSALEIQTNRYLNNQALDTAALLRMMDTYSAWPVLDQFYQLPVLLILIRATIRRM
jgi:hypothetical protein